MKAHTGRLNKLNGVKIIVPKGGAAVQIKKKLAKIKNLEISSRLIEFSHAGRSF